MGLTIHYDMHVAAALSHAATRRLIRQLRAFAKTLPIKQCSSVVEWNHEDGDPIVGAFHQCHLPLGNDSDYSNYLSVTPLELIKFSLNHPGSETAAFGLARYAPTASDPDRNIRDHPTGLVGWHWRGFCKTQYASLPSHGGWDNFFAIHDGICRILDHAAGLGLEVNVRDDSGYWRTRDRTALQSEIDRWNALIAAFTGKFKDMMGNDAQGEIIAPITQDPSFEMLEAKGQKLFQNSRRGQNRRSQ